MLEVLVVDDEQDICWALKMGLKDEGVHITHVYRGEEAIRQVRRRRFDAAIIDVKLPGMSGIEVSRTIRQLVPRLPILMISGYHYEEDQPILEGIGRGDYQGFISKPFELHHVTTLLKRAIMEGRERSLPIEPVNGSGGHPASCTPTEGERPGAAGQEPKQVKDVGRS